MVIKERCHACGKADLVQKTKNMPYVYKGQSTVLADVSGQWCPACNEAFLKGDEIDHYMAAVIAFKKKVNAGLVNGEYVAAVRKKLKLDQREAADLFGGGVNAFSRYETGKTVPPVALVALLEILDGQPELLEKVRASRRRSMRVEESQGAR